MTGYFTKAHFDLLSRWHGQSRDDTKPEQDQAYEDLKQAYEVTQEWADRVKAELFPVGRIEIRKRPTNQANKFAGYNWARIYPSPEAPRELAYTVGIDFKDGFVVKIDTVGVGDTHVVKQALWALQEDQQLVARLPAGDGLKKSFDELVAWSVDAIRKFTMRYDEVLTKLNLVESLSDEDLLKHFDGRPAFQTFRASWSREDKAMFCRMARGIHAAGLDWWHVDIGVQLRFGRRNPGTERAVGVLGYVNGAKERMISWSARGRQVMGLKSGPLSNAFIDEIKETLESKHEQLSDWFAKGAERPGLWPDQLRDEVSAPDDPTTDVQDVHEHAHLRVVNRIYYGPPGTGKTFQLSQLLKRQYEQALTSASDDELRQQIIATRIANLTWWEGAAAALFDLGGKAKVVELFEHPFIQAIVAAKGRNQNIKQTLWGTLQHHTIDESKTVNIKLRLAPAVFDKTAESVWHFAGDWREVCADLIDIVKAYQTVVPMSEVVKRYSFVTFHQSFGYEEFVEGLRPVLDGEIEGEVRYEVRSGSFKELCRMARAAPDQRFAMVIDEINRGNISKIFGELITLIEPDKREGASNAVAVSLPYSGEIFSVPANVDIIGTMNTADRSLALLDTALRRRFEFMPVMPDARDEAGAPLAGLRVVLSGQEINVPRLLSAINERIEALYDRDHCIGHAYFTPLIQVPDGEERLVALQQIFSTRILPLLEEYFFEDWQKIRLVLADNQKSTSAQFVLESASHEDELTRLFGGDHGLDTYATKRRYKVQRAAFSNPDAYIGIYKQLVA